MKPVLFWGATGQARVLREALHGVAEVVAVFDLADLPSPFAGVPIHTGEAGYARWASQYRDAAAVGACVAIGGGRGQDRLARQRWLESKGHAPLDVLHPRSFQAGDARIGRGCQLLAMSAVCSGAWLGDAVIVNTHASVDHDCRLGDGVHVGPGARLAGEVVIGDHAFIGTGAVILPRIQVGPGATVGAGAVVTRNVAPGETVVGNPARPLPQERPSA
ncbi:hypothetical protein GCM10011521_24370 [Arenimonas soli]|uniref:Sugar acetyltransferase n=1 Tax=Arenimonas soli TaxID=2269504 RepID=A0ABQ1HRD2_9GAMM|nr:NeuD/PglB/VioB family sugar acetyltransferase [Arenimonas soli]GGA85064.1 hypothetical protein GCM10011521_24370 [Arenimonas soli]